MPPNRARLNSIPINNLTNLKQLISTPNNKYDLNNNEAVLSEDRSSQYYDLINRSLIDSTDKMSNKMNSIKFQQPSFSLNSGVAQTVNRKKPLVKILTTSMTNDLVRVNPNEVTLKSDMNNTPITTENQFDAAQLRSQVNAVDNASQRMTLVKLLHTTMDAT